MNANIGHTVFDSENDFYHNCTPDRISKFLSHAKLYERSLGLPGNFAEAGVFRGASFCRFRKLGKLFQPDHARKFIGFDVFGKFPHPEYSPDKKETERQWISDGNMGIARKKLLEILTQQGLEQNIELIEGDVRETMPKYIEAHQEMSFAIVNIDLDLYHPTKAALESLFPRVVKGGIVILDDYEGFPGAKKAVDEYLSENGRKERIEKFAFSLSPCFIIRE